MIPDNHDAPKAPDVIDSRNAPMPPDARDVHGAPEARDALDSGLYPLMGSPNGLDDSSAPATLPRPPTVKGGEFGRQYILLNNSHMIL